MPDFDKLKIHTRKLLFLLDASETGLSSWCKATAEQWKAISDMWIGKEKQTGFTVILLYPGCYNDAGESETYTEYAECDTSKEAIDIVKQKASNENGGHVRSYEFVVIGVIEGRHVVNGG